MQAYRACPRPGCHGSGFRFIPASFAFRVDPLRAPRPGKLDGDDLKLTATREGSGGKGGPQKLAFKRAK